MPCAHVRGLARLCYQVPGDLDPWACIGDVEVFDRVAPHVRVAPYGVHALKTHHSLKSTTTRWVNFVSSAAREVRSVLCAHKQQSYVDVPVLARANGGIPSLARHTALLVPSVLDDEISTVKHDSW